MCEATDRADRQAGNRPSRYKSTPAHGPPAGRQTDRQTDRQTSRQQTMRTPNCAPCHCPKKRFLTLCHYLLALADPVLPTTLHRQDTKSVRGKTTHRLVGLHQGTSKAGADQGTVRAQSGPARQRGKAQTHGHVHTHVYTHNLSAANSSCSCSRCCHRCCCWRCLGVCTQVRDRKVTALLPNHHHHGPAQRGKRVRAGTGKPCRVPGVARP